MTDLASVFGGDGEKRPTRQSAAVKAADKHALKKVWKPFNWQKKALAKGKGKHLVLACGRRTGKSEMALWRIWNWAVERPGQDFWWVSPTLKQARRDIMPRGMKMWGKQKEFSDFTMLDMIFYLHNGSRIILSSGEKDHLDNLLGAGLGGAVIDEAARQHPKVWFEYVEPMLAEAGGHCWFPSTPKGRNWFWEAYNWGQGNTEKEWASVHATSFSNPTIDRSRLEDLKRRLPSQIWREQYMGEFLDAAGGAFEGAAQCEARYKIPIEFDPRQTYVGGVDLARKKDWTVVMILDGNGKMVYQDRFRDMAFESQKLRILRAARLYGDCPMWVDQTGMGMSFVEDLRNKGVRVYGIQLDHKTKTEMLQHLQYLLEIGDVSFPIGNIVGEELDRYEMEVRETGTIRWGAPPGGHDDTVIALALACWGMRRSRGGQIKLWSL